MAAIFTYSQNQLLKAWQNSGRPCMKITTIGVDLAKNIFQIHGVDTHDKPVVRRALKRGEMLPYFANLEPCLIGMEACGSAHYWARKLMAVSYTHLTLPTNREV